MPHSYGYGGGGGGSGGGTVTIEVQGSGVAITTAQATRLAAAIVTLNNLSPRLPTLAQLVKTIESMEWRT